MKVFVIRRAQSKNYPAVLVTRKSSCDDEQRGMEGVIITLNTKILVFAITENRNSLWQLLII